MKQTPTFGEILRERRSLLGLTQAELARRAGCAPITVRKMEGDGLRPSVQLAELLALALQIPEGEQANFVRLARQEKPITPIPRPTPSAAEIGLEDLTGRAVKGFQLAELIGSGGFGVVYRAVQPSVQRDVAVKIILPRFANHPTFIRRFEAEAHLVARLEHPHIVPLYDYWREPNAAYLIMRLLRGGGLNTVLAQGPLPLDIVRRIGQQVGQALAAAHAQGVLHQDIKPANILLDDLQNGYLADFGIAKNLTFAEGSSLTEQNTLVSSPAYISPEQIRDEPVRPSSDIYCFGLLLYEMLTGQAAFRGPTPVSLLQQHLNQPLPLLHDTFPDLPAGLDDVLQRATAKQPQDRFTDMNTLLLALEAALQPTISLHPPDGERQSAVPYLTPQQLAALENPYCGLRAFTESDAANFFGRETLVQELLSQLSDGSDLERFLVVIGPSGSGKSSLVKAGLLPALRRGGLPGSENWFIVDLTPGSQPWAEVADALQRVAVNPTPDLLVQLQKDNRGLLRMATHCLPEDGETELVLLVDQFEELFTLVEEEAVREAFLQSLVTAVLDPHSRLRIVITLRADFTDRPLQYVDFGELMEQRLALVLPLTPDELTQAITKPVEKLGMAMSPELVSTIIQDVGNQPGMLPLLQYALTELFEQRQGRTLTLENYKQTGGVAGALARRADEIFTHLDAAGQEAARQLFLRLITLGEGSEDTRRRVLLTELESMPVISNQSSVNGKQRVEHRLRNSDYGSPITDYGKYRLLTFDHDPVTRGPTVEVAHEALLREWPRLRGWLRDGREDVRRQRLLAQAAAQWAQNDRDDSYLLRGSRLTAFEAWAETTTVALTSDEQHYLQTSLAARDERHTAEEARRRRELETAQRLAEEQTKRAEEQTRAAHSLRRRAIFLAGALGIVALLSIIAIFLAQAANRNADLAAANERESLESYSLSLAANARQALVADNQPLALLLALAANSVDNPPMTAWHTLVDIAYAPGVNRQFTYDSPINAVAVSPDGSRLLTGSDDGLVLVWGHCQRRDCPAAR
jgi:serine/threonine protein kinase/DNA-binding XRE family transcriptional regulator